VSSVIDAALRVARDGTRYAIEAVCEAAARLPADTIDITPLRPVMAEFDTLGEDYRNPGLGARRASRLHSIEELPLALGALVASNADGRQAILAAANYGRDSDSIATMAGALCGALGGVEAVPAEWVRTVTEESRLDVAANGRIMAAVAADIFAKDQARAAEHAAVFQAIAGAATVAS
jgi:hypothetical protein